MVRTMSARLRRSFAQAARIGSTTRHMPSSGAGAAPVPPALLITIALTVALAAPILEPAILQLYGAVTVPTAAYAAYIAVSRLDVEDITPAQQMFVARQPRAAALPTVQVRSHLCDSGDAEQLARLKARVSHELRTPLNAVIGFSEMMHHEVLGPVGNERYREYVAQIRRSAEYFQEATEKTLAVTELLASPPSRHREAVDLADLIATSLDRFHETVPSARSWPVTIDPALTVESNRIALGNALEHLWSAARILAAAGDHGQPTACSVSCLASDFGHADLRFEIDNCDAALLARDTELSPGAELSLLLARLGIEAAGGALTFEVRGQRAWIAVVRLPLAAQRELQLS